MDYLHVITKGKFPRLWVAQILSVIAQNLLNFALIIRVFDLAADTSYANVSVSLLVLSFGVPAVFFSAVAGVYVDHWDRKRVMVVSNVLRALLVLNYLWLQSNLVAVLILTFFISTITQFFAPAEAAAIPVLVGKKQLVAANSLFVLTFYACFIVGYSGAAPLIKIFGVSSPFYLTFTLFAAAAILAASLPRMQAAKRLHITLRHMINTTGSELRRNWRTIVTNRNLYFPIIQLSLVQVLLGIVMTLGPALSLSLLHRPLEDASHILIIPAGVGMVAGVILVGQLVKRVAKLALVSTALVATGSALTLLGLTGQLYRIVNGIEIATTAQIAVMVAGLLLILGVMVGIISVAGQTMLQENTSDASRGKVFGALNMMINLAATLPVLVAGILADLWSVTKVIDALGFIILIFALFQLYYTSRSHRRNFFQKIGLFS